MISFDIRIGSWLLALADPNGLRVPLPGSTLGRGEVGKLCEFAAWHGVLPAVVLLINTFEPPVDRWAVCRTKIC